MIQRNIVKAKTFLNQSVARVRDVSFSRVFIDSVRETFQNNVRNGKSRSPAWLLFANETLRNPRKMGCGWASSPWLAKAIANSVPNIKNGIIVELGGGTGIVTEALLKKGIAPECLVSIEQSANLAEYLRQRCPQARVIKGDAQHLYDLLGSDCQRVKVIVSSLPFRSLPPAIGHNITKQIDKLISKDGVFIQFTYDIIGRQTNNFLPSHFKHISHKIVWNNAPPARIDVYKVKE